MQEGAMQDDAAGVDLINDNSVAIPPLVAMLCADSNIEAKEAAAVALANLSANHNEMAVALFKAIPPLVDMLNANEADEVKLAAAGALRNLSHRRDNSVAITKAGTIPPLVAVLCADGTDNVKRAAVGGEIE